MLRHFQDYFFSIIILLCSTYASATTVEATGQALIHNNNISQAREQAIADAKQQASLQAAAYISSTQQVEDGILEIDNMRISTMSQLSNIKIIDEKLFGKKLHVRISADIDTKTTCENGNTGNSFRKTVAITAFPLEHPLQASLGYLRSAESNLATQLVSRLNTTQGISALNAGNLLLHKQLGTATSRQLDNGALTTMLPYTQQLDSQFIISGVIRDLSMLKPNTTSEKNWLIDTYNKLDYKSKKHLRNFSVDLFIHDAFSGTLLEQKSYSTQGRWNHSETDRVGFATPAFFSGDYGQNVKTLLDNISTDLSQSLRCLPYSARITRTEENKLWINAGKESGLSRGDKLSVYRKTMFYNQSSQPTTELINTRLTMIVDEIQPTVVKGHIDSLTTQHNIQPDDIVMFW
ncbi:flagellar assembly protein T N-terminal domain-containing protein [Neptunomonas japonica]|uniref:Flagellar protein FlgT n=1 Tax=Neptunomonas japonica JAMM 1380 TaxID=1441457 RepID=A0A7R6PFA5_9GAMM|nr:flagellar assembly protein T N-terminal domain-containing protein [Neptunomonas japonica]BBB28523.1 conserved hypothetical protein [Neptunomonas japonica JAMM 1380]